MTSDDFHTQYAAALRAYLQAPGEKDLGAGNELGRQALNDDVSMLGIVAQHSELVRQLAQDIPDFDGSEALAFLLHTLAPLDAATRRSEEQRARADDLADRDEFRNAVVNSLQEGFFVSDRSGSVIELNDAFAKLTGYPAQGLPYRWPHPWLVDEKAARLQQSRLRDETQVQYETPIRHRDGRLVWVAANVNRVTPDHADDDVYVGTLRDITAERAFAARESAVLCLGDGGQRGQEHVGSLDDHPRRVPPRTRCASGGGRGVADQRSRTHDSGRRRTAVAELEASRSTTPGDLRAGPTSVAAHCPADRKSGCPRPIAWNRAVLTGGGGVALWLELRVPRRISGEDRLLVTVLVGHLGLAIQHVRQFEAARETSLTLQHPCWRPPSFRPASRFATSPR